MWKREIRKALVGTYYFLFIYQLTDWKKLFSCPAGEIIHSKSHHRLEESCQLSWILIMIVPLTGAHTVGNSLGPLRSSLMNSGDSPSLVLHSWKNHWLTFTTLIWVTSNLIAFPWPSYRSSILAWSSCWSRLSWEKTRSPLIWDGFRHMFLWPSCWLGNPPSLTFRFSES